MSYSWSVEDDLNALAHAFPPSGGSACTSGINVCFTDSFSPAHQIVAASISNAAFQYGGTPSGGTTAYAAVNSLNQYPSITTPSGATVPIGYDPNGNLTSDGSFTYAYDAENRLITASGNGVAAAYAYDPLGRRAPSMAARRSSSMTATRRSAITQPPARCCAATSRATRSTSRRGW